MRRSTTTNSLALIQKLKSWTDFQKVAQQVQLLEKEVFTSSAWSDDVWKGLFENRNLLFISVTRDDSHTGFAVCSLIDHEAELLRIVVKSNRRKQGFGKALLSAASDELKSQQVNKLYLEVREDNISACAFYEACGFEKVGLRKKYYKDPVCDAVQMKLIIGG